MDPQPALFRESSVTAPVDVARPALAAAAAGVADNRWTQLVLGVAAMVTIAGPQYVWTLFTGPLIRALDTNLAQLQVTFSVLIVVQTFLSPAQGKLIERFGPRVLLSIGTLVTGLSWVLASQASSVWALYLTYGLLGGIGTGIVYIGVVGHMVQWFPDAAVWRPDSSPPATAWGRCCPTFPDRRGACSPPGTRRRCCSSARMFAARRLSRGAGFPPSAARLPPRAAAPRSRRVSSRQPRLAPRQMLRTPIFWLMFVMMTMMRTSGLMVTSQMGAFAADFGMANVLVFGMPLLPLALSLDRITNGATRPFFGWVSDRRRARADDVIAFSLEGSGDDRVAADPRQPGAVRADVGRGVLRLGRDLLALPVHADRYVRRRATRPRTTGSSTSPRESGRCSAGRWPRCCTSGPARGFRCSRSSS